MGFLSRRRDFKDSGRLKEIITILSERGFPDLIRKAKLTPHVKARLSHQQETTPRLVKETLEALGPTFVKLGQLLSSRSDLIPKRYCDEFKTLQDGVSPLPFAVIKGVVESELQQPLQSLFKRFEEKPLAVALISQVHKAVLKDGSIVVVKVRRPGVDQVMRRDIEIMEYLAKRLDPHIKEVTATRIIEEFTLYTKRELDFTFELRTLKKFHTHFAESDEVIIPKVAYSTERLLIREFLKGTQLSDLAALKRAKYHLRELANIAFRAFFDQVFQLGIFPADPHPGNLLAMRHQGKEIIAFLNFGIVGFLDEELQNDVFQLLDNLVRRDVKGIVEVMLKSGRKRPGLKALEQELNRLMIEWHDSTLQEPISVLFYNVLTTCIAQGLVIPTNLLLVAKAFVTMERTASLLDPNFNALAVLKPALKSLHRHPPWQKEELPHTMHPTRDLHNVKVSVAHDVLFNQMREDSLELRLDSDDLDSDEFRQWKRLRDMEMSRKNLTLISAAFFLGSCLMAALAPDLLFLSRPLWHLGFALFLVTLLMLLFLTMNHNYVIRE